MVTTVTYGYLLPEEILFLIQLPAIGYIPRVAGCGHRTTAGDGQPSTMAVGKMILITAGFGYLIHNGLRPGYRGGNVMDIMAGLHLAMATVGTTITNITHHTTAGYLLTKGTSTHQTFTTTTNQESATVIIMADLSELENRTTITTATLTIMEGQTRAK